MNRAELLKPALVLVILLAVNLAAVAVAFLSGSSGMSFLVMMQALFHSSGGIERAILLEERLPRILLGMAVGGGLSLSGAVLQGLFRNPLVEPYTVGIAGGAGLGVAFCISLGLAGIAGVLTLPLAGLTGALAITVLFYFLAVRRRSMPVQGVLLLGVMFSFVSSSVMMLIMALSRAENLQRIIFWMMGSLSQGDGALVYTTLALVCAALVVAMAFARSLNAFTLGEETAIHLGVNVRLSRQVLFVLAAVVTGVCVAAAGVIGFVGLMVPHLMRSLAGRDNRLLLPASFLGGSAFLVLSDTLCRVLIAPLELPVGVVTGLLGGGLFIYTLATGGRKA